LVRERKAPAVRLLPQAVTPAQQKEPSEEGSKRAASEVAEDPGAEALAPKKVPESAFQQGEATNLVFSKPIRTTMPKH